METHATTEQIEYGVLLRCYVERNMQGSLADVNGCSSDFWARGLNHRGRGGHRGYKEADYYWEEEKEERAERHEFRKEFSEKQRQKQLHGSMKAVAKRSQRRQLMLGNR
jgi:hypothetical protein